MTIGSERREAVDTLKNEQIKELKERQPIPFGGWKMLFGAVVTLVLLANCVWFGFSITKQLTGKVPGDLKFDIGAFFMVVTMFGIGSYVLTGARGRWIADYWRRNFVGYVARFVLVDKPVSDALGEWPRLQHDIRTRKEDADDRWQTHRVHAPLGESNVAISLPLGGWLSQSWIRGIDRDQIGRLQGWSVKLRAIFDTGAVMVEVRCQNRRWGVNERIVTDIGSALRHLEYVATDTMHALNGSWSDIIAHLVNAEDAAASQDMEFHRHKRTMFEILHDVDADSAVTDLEWIEDRVRRLIAERDAARGEVDRYKDGFLPAAVKDRDAARQERDAAVTFIKSVVDDVEASSRLVNTLEGLKVLHSLVYWLRSIYFGKEQLPEWEGRYERVHHVITEKEWRARRRHGKAKADPASAPVA